MIFTITFKQISFRLVSIILLLVLFFGSIPQTVVHAATCIASSTGDWNSSSTWSCGNIPSTTDDVVLDSPAVVTIPSKYTAEANNLTINSGANLIMTDDAQLSVYGEWQNNGSFNAGSGQVIFAGTGRQGITGDTTFSNLEINTLEDGLVGYWKLENNADDSSGNGLNGTLENSPTFSTDASSTFFANNYALNLVRSSSQRIMVADSGSLLDSTYFTWSAWIKLTSLADHEVVMGKLLNPNNTGRELLLWQSGAVTFYLADGSNVCAYTTGSGAVTTGTWIHLAGKWAEDKKLTLYINGTSYSSTCTSFSGVPDTSYALYIGDENLPSLPRYLDGMIDEVRVYNRALSDDEIAALAAGHYPNGATLNNAIDVNGSLFSNNATLDVGTGNAAINLAGDWINDGSFRSRSGTVTLDGNSTQTISGAGKNAFSTLAISGSSAEIIDQGTLAATASTFLINDDGGIFRRADTIDGTGSNSFGLTGLIFDVTSDNYTVVSVDLVKGNHPAATGSLSGENLKTERYWVITPTGSGVANITFPHNNLSGTLSLCNYLGSESPGYHWDCSVASSTSSTIATLNNVSDPAGDWAVGIDVGPTAVTNVGITITSGQALLGLYIGLATLLIITIFLLRRNFRTNRLL